MDDKNSRRPKTVTTWNEKKPMGKGDPTSVGVLDPDRLILTQRGDRYHSPVPCPPLDSVRHSGNDLGIPFFARQGSPQPSDLPMSYLDGSYSYSDYSRTPSSLLSSKSPEYQRGRGVETVLDLNPDQDSRYILLSREKEIPSKLDSKTGMLTQFWSGREVRDDGKRCSRPDENWDTPLSPSYANRNFTMGFVEFVLPQIVEDIVLRVHRTQTLTSKHRVQQTKNRGRRRPNRESRQRSTTVQRQDL